MLFQKVWMMAVALLGGGGAALYVVKMLLSFRDSSHLSADVNAVGVGILVLSLPLVYFSLYASLQLGKAALKGHF